MLYSVTKQSKFMDAADEIVCPWNQLGDIYKFMQQHPEKRYNIQIPADDVRADDIVQQINIVTKLTENYTLSCDSFKTLLFAREHQFNCYLNITVADWETFTSLLELNVTDIRIDGELCFSMDLIRARKGSCKIRVTPNFSSNCAFRPVCDARTFFMRPEDQYLYDAIDILELQHTNSEDTLFTIYKRGTFDGSLADLCSLMPLQVLTANYMIESSFAENRINCEQKCMKKGFSYCNFCTNYIKLLNLIPQLDKEN